MFLKSHLMVIIMKVVIKHNYYTNGSELILEECDDADCFSYYRIINNTAEYIGCIYDCCGIFDDDSQNEFELIQD